MLRQSGLTDPEKIVSGLRIHQKNVGPALFGDESFEVSIIRIHHTRRTAPHHVEAGNLTRLALFVNLKKLADTDWQRQTLTARRVLQASLELSPLRRADFTGVQPQPARGHSRRLNVILREVRNIDLNARVGDREPLSIGSDDLSL